jgi:translocation and assembly module TamA
MGSLSRWAAMLALLLSTGCGAHLMGPVARVRKIGFEGNGNGFSGRGDPALRAAIAHPKPRANWIFWKKKVELDEKALEDDKLRIANWYADHGYFDAQLVRWDIREVRKAHGAKSAVVKIIGIVEEKQPSAVTSLTWEGWEGIAKPIADRIEKDVPLREGKIFTAADYDTTLGQSKNILQNQSFAYADVKGHVEVTPSQHAVAIKISVDPGPPCTFGDVTLEGGEQVPERKIRNKLVIETGEAYKVADIAATERALYGMKVFSGVDAEPDLSTKSTVIPIRIKLKPRDPREIRIGGGAELSSGRQEVLGSVEFEHNNLFHQVIELDAHAKAGYAIVGNNLSDLTDGIPQTDLWGGPVVDVLGALTFPQVPGPVWQLKLETQFEENVEEAYRYLTPSFRPSITGQIAKRWTLSLGYEYEYFKYIENQIEVQSDEQLPLDIALGHYTNTTLSQTLSWDTRNDLIRTTSGGLRSVTLLEASQYLGGDFDYVGLLPDLRGYLSLRRIFPHAPAFTVLATRFAGGWLQPYGSGNSAYVPYGERLKLGGSNTVRGWSADELGPYQCSTESGIACMNPDPPNPPEPSHTYQYFIDNQDPADKKKYGPVTVPDGAAADEYVDTVPVGGLVSFFMSFELRKFWGSFGAVLFSDIGMVWADPSYIGQIPLAPSIGTGVRYNTPVGALRLDVARRMDQIPMFEQEHRYWFHFALGEAF